MNPRRFRLLYPLSLACLLAACTTNPITGRDQFVFMVSEETAIADSSKAYQSLMGDLSKKNKISTDAKLNSRIRFITDRLIDQAVVFRPETRDWTWSVKVIDDPKTVNAFCMAGGKMAIYTGLIEKINPSDDEIAEVMGHEISHALLQHSREQIAQQNAVGLSAVLIGVAASNQADPQVTQTAIGLGAMAFILLPHSREAESEADRLGIELAAKAGYDPHAAVTLWQKMLKESGDQSKSDWLSTHPAPPKRIDALSALEPEMRVYYERTAKNSRPSRAWTSTASNERVIDTPQASGAGQKTK